MFYAPSTGGFYTLAIHGAAAIPADAVAITNEYHAELLAAQSAGKLIRPDETGRPVAVDRPPKTWSILVADKITEINAACETAIATITAGYPASEVLSWPKQEAEARSWTANAGAPTPLIDALAAGRGIIMADLVSRIIQKADAFAALSGQMIGKRQNLEDQIDSLAVDDTESLNAVTW